MSSNLGVKNVHTFCKLYILLQLYIKKTVSKYICNAQNTKAVKLKWRQPGIFVCFKILWKLHCFKQTNEKCKYCIHVCYFVLWQFVTCYMWFCWLSLIVFQISQKFQHPNIFSILDECARAAKKRERKIWPYLALWTYLEKVAPCIVEMFFASLKVDDENQPTLGSTCLKCKENLFGSVL